MSNYLNEWKRPSTEHSKTDTKLPIISNFNNEEKQNLKNTKSTVKNQNKDKKLYDKTKSKKI